MKKTEEREISYCDICGNETSGHSHCWGCGKDLCSQHHHLIDCDRFRHTYVCDVCRERMLGELNDVFDNYSSHRPN